MPRLPTEADLYIAIDRATERAGRTLARRLGRQRESRPVSPKRRQRHGTPGHHDLDFL